MKKKKRNRNDCNNYQWLFKNVNLYGGINVDGINDTWKENSLKYGAAADARTHLHFETYDVQLWETRGRRLGAAICWYTILVTERALNIALLVVSVCC